MQRIRVYPHPPEMVLQVGDRVHTGPDGDIFGRIVDIAEDRAVVLVQLDGEDRLTEWSEAYTWRVEQVVR